MCIIIITGWSSTARRSCSASRTICACAYCKRCARWHPTRNTPSTTRFDLWSFISSRWNWSLTSSRWSSKAIQIFSAESIAEVALSLARFYSTIFETIWLNLTADCAISETLCRPEIDGSSPLLVHIFDYLGETSPHLAPILITLEFMYRHSYLHTFFTTSENTRGLRVKTGYLAFLNRNYFFKLWQMKRRLATYCLIDCYHFRVSFGFSFFLLLATHTVCISLLCVFYDHFRA